jgi:hypothetical protein
MVSEALNVARKLRDSLHLSSRSGSVTLEWRANGPTIVVYLMPRSGVAREAIPSSFEGYPVVVDGALWGVAQTISN